MTILNCIIYAIGVMVLVAIFSLLLTAATFTAFDIIMMCLKKKQSQKQQPLEDTDLGKEQN